MGVMGEKMIGEWTWGRGKKRWDVEGRGERVGWGRYSDVYACECECVRGEIVWVCDRRRGGVVCMCVCLWRGVLCGGGGGGGGWGVGWGGGPR